ncbi:hypothetical protein IFO70_25485 [Phormidium tenue FACHB-886]|nr:hypothetical protein [Phormidium tenue FACHB-886]
MRSLPKLWRSCLLLALAILLGWQLSARAQSTSQLDARLSRLESANTLLQSRISRLESSLSGASSSRNITPEAPSVGAPAASGSALADDPVFKRLATLVIELRERIIALEARQ